MILWIWILDLDASLIGQDVLGLMFGRTIQFLSLDGQDTSDLGILQAFCFLSSGMYDGQDTSDLGLACTLDTTNIY